jgi:hypothetical protein
VRVDVRDPRLSERANAELTEEVRAILGRDEVELPASAAAGAGRARPREGVLPWVWERRMAVGMGLAVALVFAVLLVLTTGSWWWLPAAVLVHAAATAVVSATILRTTTLVEAPAPAVAATLQEEGVRDPERELNAQVRSFTAAAEPSGRTLVTPGDNHRRARPEESPAASHAEQETAVTPASEPSTPDGPGRPDAERPR